MGNKFAIEFFTISRISFLLLMTSISDLKSFLSNAFILKMAQCGNRRILLPLRFLCQINVDKLEPQKLPSIKVLNFHFGKFHQCKNSIRMWFHVNFEWQKNPLFSTLWLASTKVKKADFSRKIKINLRPPP